MLLSTLVSLATVLAPPSKVEFLDVIEGRGKESVSVGDVVTFSYRGWLHSTGVEFDSTKSKAPGAFKVGAGGTIEGWDTGLRGALVGTRRVIVFPASKGFGDKVQPGVPANSALGFEIDVLRIDKESSSPKVSFEELKAGAGPASKVGDTVSIHYTGSFLNGVKFDSSRDRNAPFVVKVGSGGVIAGFDQGITGMRVGQRRKVTIPFQLGYGTRGAGGVIPPHATLVFDLEMLKIN